MKKKVYLSLLVAAAISGCTFEQPKDEGEVCPPAYDRDHALAYIQNGDGTRCSEGTCPEYDYYFGSRICPKEASQCFAASEGEYYCMQACVNGLVACNGECVDPLNNPEFCGAKGSCFVADPKDENYKGKKCLDQLETCYDGECVPAGTDVCINNNVKCDGSCIDPLMSKTYCGARGECDSDDAASENYRGTTCLSYAECNNGECTCVEGFEMCGGQCAALLTDALNCGSCGNACDKDEICSNGNCMKYSCDDPAMTLCPFTTGSACKDLSNDVENCGICGTSCEARKPFKTQVIGCVESLCQYTCEAGFANCPASSDTFNCISLESMKSDRAHCGSCNNVCKDDEVCSEGSCRKASCGNACLEGSECVNRPDKCGPGCLNCGEGGSCVDGTCVKASCGNACLSGGVCVNTNDKCGPGCAKCSPTELCKDGVCTAVSCENACFDGTICSNTNEKCGTGCQNCSRISGAESTSCDNGACVVSKCQTNQHITADKRECAINTDVACGTSTSNVTRDCTKAFENGVGTCVNSQCVLGSCASGYNKVGNTCIKCTSNQHFYDAGGYCEDDSEANCGSHGRSCASYQSCIAKKCELVNCTAEVEGEACNGGVCKTTGSTGGSNIQCVDANKRDTECFIDNKAISCKSRSGATGTCIYDPVLAGKYAGRSEHWTCECTEATKVFCLSTSGSYKCTNKSDCKYTY